MNLSAKSSKPIYKTTLALALIGLLTAPSAMAFPFFKRKQPVEGLPPSAKSSPTMITQPVKQPLPGLKHGLPEPSPGKLAKPVMPQPQAESGQPEEAVASDPLKQLTEKGVFSPQLAAQTTPVTRAELAQVLVKALEQDTGKVSEFPFYRDVPLDNPAYAAIETAREKKLLTYANNHGFYEPEKPIRFGELYLALAGAISGAAPKPGRAAHLLSKIPDHERLSPKTQQAVAKMAQARFFSKVRQYETTYQPANTSVTPANLAPMISFLMYLNERRAPISLPDEMSENPVVPAGLHLVLSPATGILESNMKAGARVVFLITQAEPPVRKGGVLWGTVQEVLPGRVYNLQFDSIRGTNGKSYATLVNLKVSFPPKDKLGFIVPGESFTVVTQPVAGRGETPNPSAPPPIAPPKAVPNSSVLKAPVKTYPK